MTHQKITALVAEAVELDRDLAAKTERLKYIKGLLVSEAESRADEAVATDGGGTSLVFESPAGEIARVTFPARSLKSKIDGEGKTIEKIKAVAGRCFDRLFRPALGYRPVDGFREEARALLGVTMSGRLIKLCETESSPKVSFETKETVEA